MDPNLIYVKTALGENAILERTRVIQRNVRMVLILVDGHSSVADLTRKIGNPQLTENALVELEKAGFIELKEDSPQAEGQQSFATNSPPKNQENGPEFQKIEPSSHALDTSKDRMMPNLQISFPPLDEKDDVDSMASRFSIPPELKMREKSGAASGKERRKSGNEDDGSAAEKPSLLARLKSKRPGVGRARNDEPVITWPVRGARRGATNWAAWVFFGLMGLVALVCATVFLFPFSAFVPDVEAAFASAIGRPVTIQEMRAHIYPEPGLILSGVELGQG
ncbi:MAG: hypothetical protein LBI59_08695, partial [Candidatus Accumulibacter sp.]|nr:hypothetical protein [Accumulibacter sp.]